MWWGWSWWGLVGSVDRGSIEAVTYCASSKLRSSTLLTPLQLRKFRYTRGWTAFDRDQSKRMQMTTPAPDESGCFPCFFPSLLCRVFACLALFACSSSFCIRRVVRRVCWAVGRVGLAHSMPRARPNIYVSSVGRGFSFPSLCFPPVFALLHSLFDHDWFVNPRLPCFSLYSN